MISILIIIKGHNSVNIAHTFIVLVLCTLSNSGTISELWSGHDL